jgi:hypothetical protein
MSDSPDGPAPPVVPRWRPIIIGLLLLVAGMPESLRASPLRTRQPLAAARAEPRAEAYFARALQNQWRQVEVPLGQRILRSSDGLLPDTAFVRYLRWRRGLRTAQFDRFHPRVAMMISRDEQLRRPSVLAATLPPVLPRCDCPAVPALPPTEETSPEPASLLVAIVLGGSVALARRKTLGTGPRDGSPATSGLEAPAGRLLQFGSRPGG